MWGGAPYIGWFKPLMSVRNLTWVTISHKAIIKKELCFYENFIEKALGLIENHPQFCLGFR